MVVGVWELVLFLWSHPIISCMFLMLFSPPFFPVIVYFSPLLICTGLVAVAMVSMNMGERAAERENWRNGRLHEAAAAAAHHVEMMPLKPVRESWLEWMKNKEEKVKAWVDSRFLNQNKWQFRTSRSALVVPEEEEESMAVDLDSCDEGYRISSYRELSHPTPARPIRVRPTPILTSLDMITPPQTESEVLLPPLAEVLPVSHDISHSSVREAGPPVQVGVEDGSFTFPSLEQRSVPSFEVPPATAEEEVLKGEIVVPSTATAKEEGEPLPVVKAQAVFEKEILSVPKAESLVEEEPPISHSKNEPRTSDARATEVSILPSQEEVLLPRVDNIIESRSLNNGVPEEKDGLLVKKHETTVKALESIPSGEESFAFAPHGDRAAKIEALLKGLGAVSGGDLGIPVSLGPVHNAVVDEETRDVQAGAELHGSRSRAVEVLVSPEFSAASGEDRKASPEAEAETSFFIRSTSPDVVVQPPERFIGTEKIIFVDEPSKFTTVHSSRSMVAEAEEAEQMETRSIIQKAIGQMLALEAEDPHESGSRSLKKDRRSSEDGLDENIESCGNTPPPSTTISRSSSNSSAAAGVLLQQNSEQQMAMALVRSVSDGALSAETSALVPVYPQLNSLELLAENMEPIMMSPSSIYNDTALATSSSVVLDKSFSLNTTFRAGGGGGGEEHDDLTARFHALKKSMSLHTTRRWEQQQQQPISLLRAAAADAATNAAVVPVYVPDVGTRVHSAPFSESLVLPETNKSRPRVNSGNLESIESITARLLTKFTPNIGSNNNTPFTRPPSRPVPALPAAAAAQSDKNLEIAPASSVEPEKTLASAPPSVGADESLAIAPEPGVSEVEGTENVVPSVDDGGAATTVKDVEEGTENLVPLVVPLLGVTTLPVIPVKTSLSSKKSLTSFLSRRREKLMSSTLMEAFSNSGDGERLKKKVVSSEKAAADMTGGTSIEIAAAAAAPVEDRDEGGSTTTTTTSGRQLKEKVISPLKRVFSMDANSGSGSSDRKGDSSQPSPVKASAIREKQSVIDRSKGKFKKLFSSEAGAGGLTKSEAAEVVGKVAVLEEKSLRKSKSKSAASNTHEQNAELGDIQERNADLGDIQERNAELGDIQERNAELGDEQKQNALSKSTTPKFELQSDAANGMDAVQDDVSSSTTVPILEPPSDAESGVDAVQDILISSSITPKLELPPDADDKIDAGVQLEKEQMLPGIEAASLAETAEEEVFISKSGPLLKSSAPTEETMPPPVEEVFIISKSEPLLRSSAPTVETIPPPLIQTKEADVLLKGTESKVTKSPSSEKKFSWSWTKKKRCSDPIGESVDRFRSPERSASWSAKGIEEESRVILMSPLTRFHSSSAIMSPVNEENAHTGGGGGGGGPWNENHSGEFRFSQPSDFPTSNHRHPPNADSSPFKRSPSSWWSPKTDPPPPAEQVETAVENVVELETIEKATPSPKLKKVSSSWWSRKHSSRADSKAVQSSDSKAVQSSSSPPDLPLTGSSTNITADGIEKTWWTRRIRRADPNAAVQSSSPNLPPTQNSTPPHGIVRSGHSSSPPDFPPRDFIRGNNNYFPHGIEKSGPLYPLPAVPGHEKNARDDAAAAAPVDTRRSLQNDLLLDDDDDEVAEVAPRPRHRRERSESLPSRATFSRLRGRQTSLSEITLPRTPELLSPASSSGRATDYNNTTMGICTTGGTTSPFSSMSRTDGEQYHHHHRDHHPSESSSSNAAAGGWRTTTTNSSTPPFRASSIRTLDLANEQLRGGSPLFHHRSSANDHQLRGGSPLFHRNSDRDVTYRNSPSAGAEIRITDKLKVPLEEVLSLLSTGDSDELRQHLPTAGSKPAGRAVASDSRRAASSSSSSEEETSEEEEWSATSEDEDESPQQQQQQPQLLQQQQPQPQQPQQQFTTAGRIRRRLPHYIFSRGEATAN